MLHSLVDSALLVKMACGAILIHDYCFMRKLFLFFIALYTCVGINAQVSVDDYIGTWRGEKGDTLHYKISQRRNFI